MTKEKQIKTNETKPRKKIPTDLEKTGLIEEYGFFGGWQEEPEVYKTNGGEPNIQIQKIGITDLAVDAIVNAANEGLWAGGGVCGAIFRTAGHDQLQRACNKIGHCDTGSAVITPGFDLKAKYVIHAVGPVWAGGGQGEEELLYGAYYRSLELAVENGCASIAFPLISSGIFGYPKQEAWRVALRACREFLEAHPEHPLQIVFAVLDDRVLEMGQKDLARLERNA